MKFRPRYAIFKSKHPQRSLLPDTLWPHIPEGLWLERETWFFIHTYIHENTITVRKPFLSIGKTTFSRRVTWSDTQSATTTTVLRRVVYVPHGLFHMECSGISGLSWPTSFWSGADAHVNKYQNSSLLKKLPHTTVPFPTAQVLCLNQQRLRERSRYWRTKSCDSVTWSWVWWRLRHFMRQAVSTICVEFGRL